MLDIRREMPVLARHEGDWIGTYTLDLIGNSGTLTTQGLQGSP
jgi:hypothetical protein